MKVDSHQHFWRFNHEDYGWISEEQGVIRRDFLPKDLGPVLESNEIDACVAVQARQSDVETAWLLQLADDNAFIKGVVGWVDLKGNNLEQQLEQYKSKAKLKGFRHVLQDEVDPLFMLDEQFVNGLKLIADQSYTYDLLIFARQLPQVIELVKQLPVFPIVLDHIAKPDISTGSDFETWKKDIMQLAQHQHVMCKMSGMVTEADVDNWQQSDFVKYMDVIFQAFGPERVMYGSDWPVCLLGGSYPQIRSIVSDFVVEHYPEFEAQIFGDNAARFYNL